MKGSPCKLRKLSVGLLKKRLEGGPKLPRRNLPRPQGEGREGIWGVPHRPPLVLKAWDRLHRNETSYRKSIHEGEYLNAGETIKASGNC